MKHLPLLLLAAVPLLAEPVTVRESVLLKADRAVVSIKSGTVVELVARDGDSATIKYHNVTGKIPASKLGDADAPADPPKAEEKKPEADKPLPAEAKLSAGQTPGLQKQTTAPRPPQTNYGKAVQKARDNAAAHEKNTVQPTDEILKEKQ